MGQMLSSEEERSQVSDTIGSILYDAMAEGGALPDLAVGHPSLLANQDEAFHSQAQQLQQLQGDIGNRAPAYLRDLIGRLTTFSDEPRLAGLVGLVVTVVMDMAYTSSRRSSGASERSAGSSSCQQRAWELQEVMEEYLKRCRINLGDTDRLIQDSVRLEARISLTLTQLKSSMLAGDCDSTSLRHWAGGALFHAQMLLQLADLEERVEPRAARAALEQYREDLAQIIPAYRRYKSRTVCVVKRRGGVGASGDPADEGAMTGLTVTDRETGRSVTLPLSTLEAEIERRRRRSVCGADEASAVASADPDLITSDQYGQAYVERLFSDEGPLAALQNYFIQASDNLRTAGARNGTRPSDGETKVDETEEESDGRE